MDWLRGWPVQVGLWVYVACSIVGWSRMRDQESVLRELRVQNQLLRRFADAQEARRKLTVENCGVLRATGGMCAATLTDLVERLGLADTIAPLLKTVMWQTMLSTEARGVPWDHGGMGGGGESSPR